jgi:cellulose synthase/poly-beta-1,6-N-acetylglucosamine synthase-like glycosyltransferase
VAIEAGGGRPRTAAIANGLAGVGRLEPDWSADGALLPSEDADPGGGQYEFLLDGWVPELVLREAVIAARRIGCTPHEVLIRAGAISSGSYAMALAERLRADVMPELGHVREAGPTAMLDAVSAPPDDVLAAARALAARGIAPLLTHAETIAWSESEEQSWAVADGAANGLARTNPEMSAATPFATWQVVAAPMFVGLTVGGLVVAPRTTVGLLAVLATLPVLLVVGLRVLSLAMMLGAGRRRRPVLHIADEDLPSYSVLVPLYGEAAVLPDLVRALSRLDYPATKLEVLIILESVDRDTRAAAAGMVLPGFMRVIVVPDVAPRTKPKALNYALQQARGSFVVVFDAEDEPEPDQLRRAVEAFAFGPGNLACVQARLSIYNGTDSILTRQFTLEYCGLFDALLPALQRIGMPLPLGGTSNHFPRSVLDELGGWDPHNVTEDADLGIRIARRGWRVEVLASTTYEEAPQRLGVWVRQRTRWLKGFMQTWLVHMRRPRCLLADLGPAGFLGFHAVLGGVILTSLIHPVFVTLLGIGVVTGKVLISPVSMFGAVLIVLAGFNLVAGYLAGMAMAGVAAGRRGLFGFIPHLLVMPLYWVLISLVSYRALIQLVREPYLWEKTPHRARVRRRAHRRRQAGQRVRSGQT